MQGERVGEDAPDTPPSSVQVRSAWFVDAGEANLCVHCNEHEACEAFEDPNDPFVLSMSSDMSIAEVNAGSAPHKKLSFVCSAGSRSFGDKNAKLDGNVVATRTLIGDAGTVKPVVFNRKLASGDNGDPTHDIGTEPGLKTDAAVRLRCGLLHTTPSAGDIMDRSLVRMHDLTWSSERNDTISEAELLVAALVV